LCVLRPVKLRAKTPCYAPAPSRRCFCLTSVCLSRTSGLSREQRDLEPRKTKIGTEVAHVSRDSDTTFKVKRSRSPSRLLIAALTRKAAAAASVERIRRGKVLLRCVLSAALEAFGSPRGGEGRGYTVSLRSELVKLSRGSQLTQVCLEKWPLKRCLFMSLSFFPF